MTAMQSWADKPSPGQALQDWHNEARKRDEAYLAQGPIDDSETHDSPWRDGVAEPHLSLVDQHLPGCPAATDDGGPCRCDDEPEESR